jgi:hypothetical protein
MKRNTYCNPGRFRHPIIGATNDTTTIGEEEIICLVIKISHRNFTPYFRMFGVSIQIRSSSDFISNNKVTCENKA